MKRIAILALGVITFVGLLTGCSDESSPTSTPGMTAPKIHSLTVTPPEAVGGSSVTVVADVERPMDVPLEFEWSVSKGHIAGATIGSEVVWITPTGWRSATITCRATNQFGSDELSTVIQLNGGGVSQ